MKKRSMTFYNTALAVGAFLIVAGFLMFAYLAGGGKFSGDFLRQSVFLLAGAAFVYLALLFTRSSFHFFVGLLLVSSSALNVLVERDVIPFTMREWWPLVVILSGLCFFAAGIWKSRRLRLSFMFPSVTLIALGALFMFFSFDVITMSFRSFVSVFGPFFLVAVGLFIVLFFLLQKKYTQLQMPDDDLYEEDSLFSEQDNAK